MKTISMHELRDHLKSLSNDEVILDVRTPEEYAEGHIPGSRNIAHEQVGRIADELRSFKRVYVHCRSGKRAQMAFQSLTQAGLENLVCIADSGMLDWIEAGYPIEK